MTCGRIDLGCTKCRLSKKRTLVVPGNGPCSSRIVFIGEAPGRDEDVTGEPFVGAAGKLLNAALEKAGVPRSQVFCTNIVKCRPPDNRKPRKDEIRTCTELYLSFELETVRPRVVCALGQTATGCLIGLEGKMSDAVGRGMSRTICGRPVKFFAAYHPAAVLYQRKKMKDFQESVRAALVAAGLI